MSSKEVADLVLRVLDGTEEFHLAAGVVRDGSGAVTNHGNSRRGTINAIAAFVGASAGGNRLNVKTYGAKGDGVTNDSAAFLAAIADAKAKGIALGLVNGTVAAASPSLWVPAGIYYMGATTLDINHTIVIEGEGTGMGGGGFASQLKWAANTTGVRLQAYDTSGVAAVDNVTTHTAAAGTVLKGLALFGAYAGAEGEYHGVHGKVRFSLVDCHIEGFQGDGIYSHASAGSGGADEGNANSCWIYRTSVSGCRDGINIDGADTNIWSIVGGDYSLNRRWGVNDSSFLGNSYFGVHASDNGLVTPSAGAIPSVVTYGGNRYCLKNGGNGANAPSGTTADTADWYYMFAGGAVPAANINLWAAGTTYRAGGSYTTDASGNANNLFSGCYHETAQGFAQIYNPSLVSGGSMRPNVRGVGVIYGNGSGGGGIGINGDLSTNGQVLSTGFNHSFGPTSGGDVTFYLQGTGTGPQMWFQRYGVAVDGYLSYINGACYHNALNGHHVRHNGNDIAVTAATGFLAGTDNTLTLGGASNRWSVVYAGSGTINTSDVRAKQFLPIDDAVLDAWEQVEWTAYQFLDAIADKGADVARIHFGLGAQHVADVFTAHGLDARRYAFFCFDQWDDQFEPELVEQPIVIEHQVEDPEAPSGFRVERDEAMRLAPKLDDAGAPVMRLVRAAGDRYGIRYDEALALEAMCLRRRVAKLEQPAAAA